VNESPRAGVSASRRGFAPVRSLVMTAGVIVGAIILAVVGSGATYALWNGSKPVGAASITTGSTGLTVNGVVNYSIPVTSTPLVPGISAVSPQLLSIQNTSTTPLSVSVGTPAFADPTGLQAQNGTLVITLLQSTTCAQSVDGTPATAWTVPVVLAAGATLSACLQVTLSSSAPSSLQGQSATFTLPLIGSQVRNR
jgi:hypothetical protein